MDIRTALPAPRLELRTVDPSQKVVFLDDFLAGAIEGRISSTAGIGVGNAAATVVANSVSGEVTMVSSSTVVSHASDGTTLTLDQLNFKANQGALVMETRLKVDAITDVYFFVGFTDVISTTVEYPIFKAADDIDSDAQNACGVCFDTGGTTDQFFQGGVKGDTDTAATHSGTAPSAGTYVTIRVEVSAAGAVQGFINGTAIGTATANAVTITTALTPSIVIGNMGAAARTMTVDYLWCSQSR